MSTSSEQNCEGKHIISVPGTAHDARFTKHHYGMCLWSQPHNLSSVLPNHISKDTNNYTI